MFKHNLFLGSLVVGVTVSTGAAYAYFKRLQNSWSNVNKVKEDDDDELKGDPEKNVVELTVNVPKELVSGLIGTRGKNIKSLQIDSNTCINIDDTVGENGNRVCVIRGQEDDVFVAHDMIRKFLSSRPIVTAKEVKVPTRFIGRMIGKGGQTIRGIRDLSKARIDVERKFEDDDDDDDEYTIVTLTGTQDQIYMAELLIQDEILDWKKK